MDANDTIAFEDDNLHLDGKPRGLIFAVSAPSGAGKTTLCNMLLQEFKDIKPSVSFTTRTKRAGEEDGVSYHFINDAEFDRMVKDGEFIEWANVFGKRYGTAYKSVLHPGSPADILLEIDVQGVEKLIETRRINRPVTVFITPPSYEGLRERLKKRGGMDDAELDKRLNTAYAEIKKSVIYDYVVTNDNLGDAYLKLKSIIIAERCKNLRKINVKS